MATSEPVATCVHEDPPEPGIELLRVAEPGEMLPGGDERILRGVLGIGFGSQDREGRPVQATTPGGDERVEGSVITPSSPLDGRSLIGANRPHHVDARVRHGCSIHWPYEQMTFQATPRLAPGTANVGDPAVVKPDRKYRPPVPMGGTKMTTGHTRAFVQGRFRAMAGAALLTATFAAGLATGQGLPGAAAGGPAARPGSQPTGAGTNTGGTAGKGPLACFVSSALDTSKPYLTVQHGVIVVPAR